MAAGGRRGLLIGATWVAALTSTIVVPASSRAGRRGDLTGGAEPRAPRGRARRARGARLPRRDRRGRGLTLLICPGDLRRGRLTSSLKDAANKIQGWLQDLGVDKDSAQQANSDASAGLSDGFHALLNGVAAGRGARVARRFPVVHAAEPLLLLKDGPSIRAWAEGHLGLPKPVAHTAHRTLQSLRGYFVGVTVVAAFNGIVIGLGALIVGVPLAGSIAVVNFVAAYIPFLGAWAAGAFTVLIALGSEGPEAALAMAVIALLANGALQQLVQPIAYGAALGIHPLAVLIVTIAAGALFGTIGLVLAAPLTAAVRIAADLAPAARVRRRRRPSAILLSLGRWFRSRVKADAQRQPRSPRRPAPARGVRTSTRVVRVCSPALTAWW